MPLSKARTCIRSICKAGSSCLLQPFSVVAAAMHVHMHLYLRASPSRRGQNPKEHKNNDMS